MARRKGKFLSGILGPIVLKVVAGKQVATTRVQKGKMKKTPGMRKASNTFGMGSKLGGKIRLSFRRFTQELLDTQSCSRLSAKMFALLKLARNQENAFFSFDEHSFDSLSGYDFNLHSPLRNWLLVQPEINFVEGQIKIGWPNVPVRTALKFPPRAALCKITMGLTFFRLEDGFRLAAPLVKELLVPKNQVTLKEQVFELPVPDGCLCVLGLFLNYRNSTAENGVELNTATFNPAGIVSAVVTPGEYVDERKFDWFGMIGLKFLSGDTVN